MNSVSCDMAKVSNPLSALGHPSWRAWLVLVISQLGGNPAHLQERQMAEQIESLRS
jgi:hypothetical protein